MNKMLFKTTLFVQVFAQVPFRGFMGVLIAAFCLLSLSSCEIDSYAEPDGIVAGSLRDAKTGGVFWTEQPNGFQLECTETSWTESLTKGGQTFWGKADGSFYNCRVFAATYSIQPVNGAFHSAVAQEVEIRSGQETALVFDVIPYCSFQEASIEKDPNTAGAVLVKLKVTTNPAEGIPATPRHWRLFATSRTAALGANIYDTDVSTSDQALTESQLGTTITYSKTGFKTGTKYYLRLGARCDESPQGRYNMTEIVEIQF